MPWPHGRRAPGRRRLFSGHHLPFAKCLGRGLLAGRAAASPRARLAGGGSLAGRAVAGQRRLSGDRECRGGGGRRGGCDDGGRGGSLGEAAAVATAAVATAGGATARGRRGGEKHDARRHGGRGNGGGRPRRCRVWCSNLSVVLISCASLESLRSMSRHLYGAGFSFSPEKPCRRPCHMP